MKLLKFLICKALVLLSILFSLSVTAADSEKQMQALDNAMSQLERDISRLEESLLFPPITRTKVYLSVQSGADFTLRSIALHIDNRQQSYHIYSEAELDALKLGGVQTLWEGNVALGERKLRAIFDGVNRKGEKIQGEAELTFEKTLEGRALELKIAGNKNIELQVKDWGAK